MAKKNPEMHKNAKQKAYEEKQARQGHKVVMSIIAGLIILALFYMVWIYMIMGV